MRIKLPTLIISRLLAAVVVLCAVLTSPAWSQTAGSVEALGSALNPSIVALGPLGGVTPDQYGDNNSSCNTCPPDDYWILSLRCCPQKMKRIGCECCWQFMHCGPNRCQTPSSHAEFLASLDPQVPVCFMIHGSYVEWKSARVDSRNSYCWIRNAAPHLPIKIVYVTWPSDPCLPPLDILALGRKSARNAFHIANLIRTIPADHPISLVGHSHGARMATATLHLLGGGEVQGYCLEPSQCAIHRYRAVLAAAAIDHNWLNPGKRYGCALPVTECLLNFRTRKDRALFFYKCRKPFSRSSLGREGFSRKDLCAMGTDAQRVNEFDVTDFVGTHHFWQFYTEHRCLAASTIPYVYFPDVVQQVPPEPARDELKTSVRVLR